MSATTASPKTAPNRFTLDGSDALELRLAGICEAVVDGAQRLAPSRRLEAVVLGGGYGRGQGGVLKLETGDHPYNDLEFYVFVRGNRFWNERAYGPEFRRLGERLSADAGLHVEFKIDSFDQLRRGPVSMFSYDLLSGCRILFGSPALFRGCEHHLHAAGIPLEEATRLLLNRCTGLLLAKGMLRKDDLSSHEQDFIGRNLAKAELALGDALLTVAGQYHWDCQERERRVQDPHFARTVLASVPGGDSIRNRHSAAVEFKLHPQRRVRPAKAFRVEHDEVCRLASSAWLWLESRRLDCAFNSPRQYALSQIEKWQARPRWRNGALNIKALGIPGAFGARATRHPRERLLNSLPLLLWDEEFCNKREASSHLRKQLGASARDWEGWFHAYEHVWRTCS